MTNIYHCAHCGKECTAKPIVGANYSLVSCPNFDCPGSHYALEPEQWNQRGPHELLVAHIPLGEPIFVLRAQDALIQPTMKEWLTLAEGRVSKEKVLKASIDFQAILKWQRENPTLVKIPD